MAVLPASTETTSLSRMMTLLVSLVGAMFMVAVMVVSNTEESELLSQLKRISADNNNNNNHNIIPRRSLLFSASDLKVYYDSTVDTSSTIYRKLQHELQSAPATLTLEPVPLNVHQPPSFLRECPGASERVQTLLDIQQPHLALEVLKYCAFVTSGGTGLYLDSRASVLMDTLEHVVQSIGGGPQQNTNNLAVLNDPFVAASIHGAILYLHPGHATNNLLLVQRMLEILISTKLEVLLSNPTLLPKSLYDLVATGAGTSQLVPGKGGEGWYFLQHSCTIEPLGGRQVTAPISSFALQSYR